MNISIINPALLIAAPLILAFIAVIIKKIDKAALSIAVVLNLLYSVYCTVIYTQQIVYTVGGFKPPFGISLVMDGYALISVVLINAIFALMVLMSFTQIKKYAVVLLVSLAALNGIVLTGDLFNLFVFMEIAAISAYIMTAMNKGFKATFNYLIVGQLASGLYLFGIAVIYNIFGTLNIIDLKETIGGTVYAAMALPVIFIFAGLSAETKLIPFGGWVRGVLKDANGLVGALLLSAYAGAMLLVFGRLINAVFVISSGLKLALSLIAVLTLVLAEASAFAKRNLKEILLFSSIAQSGLVVVLFLNGLTLPAVLVLVGNVVSKLVLFTISAKLKDDTGSDYIYDLKGVFSKYKLLGLGYTVSAMSLIGLPLFYGFIAKANALIGLMTSGNIWLPVVVLLVSVVEGIYFIRILTTLWNVGEEGKLATDEDIKDVKLTGHIRMCLVAVLIAVLILVAGILPLTKLTSFFNSEFISFLTNNMGGV